ncbi:MAG: ABC transporter permease [Spirochaetes bacterium]|nr:MAG: ABC transporter permease [Spirochaetota bacterium]
MIGMSIVKRKPLPGWVMLVIPVAAVFVTLLITSIPILIAGGNVFKAYGALFQGALGSKFNLLETFVKASPLILTGLAVAFAFRAKFWNIGAEGQLFAGAIMATWVGIYFTWLPGFLVLPVMIILGFLGGGLWATIPAFLKTKLKVDDVVTTLLLNYVIFHMMGALLFGPMQMPGSSWPRSASIMDAAFYPMLIARSRFHLGIIISFVAVLVIWFINNKTVFGYQSKGVGINLNAAKFGGINTNMVILKTAIISGGLAGLAGVGEVAAIHHHLMMDVSPGYGYTGIVIAMLGNLHPVGVALAAFFFSVISVGAQTMSRVAGIPIYIVGIIEGVALMTMLIFILLTEYKIRWTKS